MVAVLATDITTLDQSLERIDSVGHAQSIIAATMHQLQQLDSKFDVA